jgi:hypothetical protein
MCAGVVDAQSGAWSAAELQRLADTLAIVTVTDTTGRESRGRITGVSDSLLSLSAGNDIRTFPADTIRSVRVRKEDPVLNGALTGAAVSGGLASLMFLDNECRDDPVCYEATGVYAGVGALVGLGIDMLIHRSVIVYSASASRSEVVVTVASLLTHERKGLRLTIRF